MNRYLILIFIALFFSCKEKQISPIEYINVLYYNGLFERTEAVGCHEIINMPIKNATSLFLEGGTRIPQEAYIIDTIITDKQVLHEVLNELKLAKSTKNYSMDARMKCYIQFTDGRIDSLCTNQFYTYGYYNGNPIMLTNKFAYLLRKHCGFYEWIGIDQMQYFDELNDSTLEREKVKSHSGEEY